MTPVTTSNQIVLTNPSDKLRSLQPLFTESVKVRYLLNFSYECVHCGFTHIL